MNPADLVRNAHEVWARTESAPPTPQLPPPSRPVSEDDDKEIQRIVHILLGWATGQIPGAYELKESKERMDKAIERIKTGYPKQFSILGRLSSGRIIQEPQAGRILISILIGNNPTPELLARYSQRLGVKPMPTTAGNTNPSAPGVASNGGPATLAPRLSSTAPPPSPPPASVTPQTLPQSSFDKRPPSSFSGAIPNRALPPVVPHPISSAAIPPLSNQPASAKPTTPARPIAQTKPITPTKEQLAKMLSNISPQKLQQDLIRALGRPSVKRKRGETSDIDRSNNLATTSSATLTAISGWVPPANPPVPNGMSQPVPEVRATPVVSIPEASPVFQASQPTEARSPRLSSGFLSPSAAELTPSTERPLPAVRTSPPSPQVVLHSPNGSPPHQELIPERTGGSSFQVLSPRITNSPLALPRTSPQPIETHSVSQELPVVGTLNASSHSATSPIVPSSSGLGPMDVDELVEEQDIDQLLGAPIENPDALRTDPRFIPKPVVLEPRQSPLPSSKPQSTTPGPLKRKRVKYFHPTPGLQLYIELPGRPDLVAAARAKAKARSVDISSPLPVPEQSVVDKGVLLIPTPPTTQDGIP